MSLRTFSRFYYGHEITLSNQLIDFSEGAGELTGEVDVGSFTLTTFIQKISAALTAEGGQAYTLTVDRDTRLVTISATSNFSLLVSSGTHGGQSVFSLLGFTGADLTGDNSYTGNLPTGFVYLNQFILQDYVTPDNFKQAVESTKNKTSSGRVELVKFGTERFFEMNIKYVNDYPQDNGVILNNPSGVQDLQDFMDYITELNPIEFIPDTGDEDTFFDILLESTPDSKDGTGFKLKEKYDQGLPGYYETGVLRFRVNI